MDRGDDGPWRRWTVETMDRGDDGPWRRWTVETMDHGDDGPWRRWTMDGYRLFVLTGAFKVVLISSFHLQTASEPCSDSFTLNTVTR
ncbi:hypothetical protein ILYODFUR_028912 [Ilyodon furcidens]|uniref:Uncharacterized protein n=1 Tax=Ilyodon furcidens TaxID=33524 RepID=A0ABV0U9D7_9TELE